MVDRLNITYTLFQSLYTAIIVEPRQHKALSFVLKNFLDNLSNEWNIIIFHGNLNIEFIKNIIENELSNYKERLKLINLHVDNLTRDEYSRLFIRNRLFYDYIPTETFLVFQTDSMIFPKNKHLLNNFLKYDYVGAPWPHIPKNNQLVGNGGLSLRKKSKMLEIMELDTNVANYDLSEDVFFACTDVVNLYKPSPSEAMHFSIENIFCDSAFGGHQPWRIGSEKIKNYYPEIMNLFILQF